MIASTRIYLALPPLALVLLGGCDSAPAVAPVTVASVGVTPSTATLEYRELVRLMVELRDAQGNILSERPVDWTSSDTTVARVSPEGSVEGRGLGSAVLTAAVEGRSGSAEITVDFPASARLPTPVAGGATWLTMAASFEHTCALAADGAAYCWGNNSAGQLGTGSLDDSPIPAPVAGATRFERIVLGRYHSCALTAEGVAFCWGRNEHGQLGIGAAGDRSEPVPVAGDLRFASLAAGDRHTCGRTGEGDLYCWGADEHGALGAEATTETCFTSDGPYYCRTQPYPATVGFRFASVAAGGHSTCGITDEGTAYCWGAGALGTMAPLSVCEFFGRTGPGQRSTECTREPLAVETPHSFRQLAVGAHHSCGATAAGSIQCWGRNESGQLGAGTSAESALPVQVPGGIASEAISVGDHHSCALAVDGQVLCWGLNSAKQLGNNEGFWTAVPRPIAAPPNAATVVSAGGWHSCVVAPTGSGYCWGLGPNLGTGG